MMSSETRKKAWRSSVSQPRVATEWNWVVFSGAERRTEAVSRTEMPRLHFPPRVLWRRAWSEALAGGGQDFRRLMVKMCYILVPC